MKTIRYVLLAVLLGLAPLAEGALPTTGTTVWEIRPTTGNDANGGCYITGSSGTDFSQQGSPQKAFTDLVIGSTTTQATSVAHAFASTDVGNCINVVSGSGCTAGWYYVVSVATVTATLDRAIGTAASVCTANEGGALQTLAQYNTNLANGYVAYMKGEATVTTTTTTLFNTFVDPNAGLSASVSGYSNTRGDNGQVTIQQTAEIAFDDAIVQIANNTGGFVFRNFILDCNSQTGSQALHVQGTQGPNIAFHVSATNCKSSAGAIGFNNTGHMCINCSVTGYAGSGESFALDGGNGGNTCIDCVATGGSAPGFVFQYSTCIRCISANNTGAASDGFQISANSTASVIFLDACVSYGNGRDGLRMAPGVPVTVMNSVFYGNAGVGINDTIGTVPAAAMNLNYNALGGNTGGNYTNVSAGGSDVSLSGDPFVAGASNNFALNATAGAGAAASGAGFPGVLTVGGTGHLDIGALQHLASGGGTSGSPIR